jgi:hypothetical protein
MLSALEPSGFLLVFWPQKSPRGSCCSFPAGNDRPQIGIGSQFFVPIPKRVDLTLPHQARE